MVLNESFFQVAMENVLVECMCLVLDYGSTQFCNCFIISFLPKTRSTINGCVTEYFFLKNLKELTDMQTLDGFVNGQWFIMLPFVLAFFAILFTNQIYTREIDTRSIIFL